MIFITLLSEKTKKGDPAHHAPVVSLWMDALPGIFPSAVHGTRTRTTEKPRVKNA
jgi:hypothetical protein